ncbi:MAG: hypothetical protein INF16_13220 [Methylobacterium sp.]|jgi:hypothetical protein|nr:hypothetical protein [Methylobacterium sp.]MCA3649745.1 hypothetical protein [Methylobacterium sp.]MCA3655680.1 hypothetical protein [Methylobacterium sp.]MCA3658888.1 hypothetical protein [Methylobacterium sp.]MCA3663821.1 hypothetical protein [Methylobacterium sp.]
MLRFLPLGLIVLLVLLPSLLILFATHRPLKARIPMATMAFISPVLMFGLVNMLPYLTNDVRNAPQWAHLVGLVLWGAGFFLPWLIFALFLHVGRKAGQA